MVNEGHNEAEEIKLEMEVTNYVNIIIIQSRYSEIFNIDIYEIFIIIIIIIVIIIIGFEPAVGLAYSINIYKETAT